MAFAEAFDNVAAAYRFHASLRGGLLWRWAYLSAYYLIFILFRWGDRYQRALDWLKGSGLSDVAVEVETPEGIRLRLDLHTAFDPLFSIFHDRDYERLEAFRPKAGDVVVDLGANVGVFTALAAKAVGKSGRVVAVEPHPGNFEALSENMERNGFDNVRLVNAAADEREGSGRLYLHERCINHSLLRPSGRSVPVALRTLDGILKELGLGRADMIKIDTEGNVPAILRGAAGILRSSRPRIVFEKDTPEEDRGVEALLRELDYETRDIRTITYAWPKEKASA